MRESDDLVMMPRPGRSKGTPLIELLRRTDGSVLVVADPRPNGTAHHTPHNCAYCLIVAASRLHNSLASMGTTPPLTISEDLTPIAASS
jgi:hypothetical protein